jgi:hypothetical protein
MPQPPAADLRRPDRSACAVRQHQPALQASGDSQLREPGDTPALWWRRPRATIPAGRGSRTVWHSMETLPRPARSSTFPCSRRTPAPCCSRRGTAGPQQGMPELHRVAIEGTDLRSRPRRLPYFNVDSLTAPVTHRPAMVESPLSFFLAAVPDAPSSMYWCRLHSARCWRRASPVLLEAKSRGPAAGSSVAIDASDGNITSSLLRRHEDLVHPRRG